MIYQLFVLMYYHFKISESISQHRNRHKRADIEFGYFITDRWVILQPQT